MFAVCVFSLSNDGIVCFVLTVTASNHHPDTNFQTNPLPLNHILNLETRNPLNHINNLEPHLSR